MRIVLHTIITIFVLMSLIGCGDGDIELTTKEVVDRRGIVYCINSEVPFTGKVVSLYRSKIYQKGKKEGENIYYHKNGKLGQKTNYENNKIEGSCTKFHSNGQLSLKCNYKNNKRDGLQIKYWKNGETEQKDNFENGELHGLQEEYTENGELTHKRNYKNGKRHGLCEWFGYPHGLLKKSINYKDR